MVMEGDLPVAIPPLPPHQWHEATRHWWSGVFTSPVASEYVAHDREIARATLERVERLYRSDRDDPATTTVAARLSAEIRLRETQLSLGPAERLRQRIVVKKAGATQRPKRSSTWADNDPRDLLVES